MNGPGAQGGGAGGGMAATNSTPSASATHSESETNGIIHKLMCHRQVWTLIFSKFWKIDF